MKNTLTTVELDLREKNLQLETGLMAKQADGAVVARYGETVVLATAVSAHTARAGLDFFPLTIDYLEKTYAAGKIPGGFLKREGRLSEKEVLTSRLIDRPTRPLFPKGFYYETQGIVNVLSFGEENVADVLGITAMSAALSISDIPWDGPVAAVRVGRISDTFIINPDLEEVAECDLNLTVAGREDAVMMVEGGATEVPESVVLEAIDVAHQEIKRIVAMQKDLQAKVGKPKREVVPPVRNEDLERKVEANVLDKIKETITIPDKLMRQKALDDILANLIDELSSDSEEDRSKEISGIFGSLEKKLVRDMILTEKRRADGRKPDDIRPISSMVSFLAASSSSASESPGTKSDGGWS